MEMPKLHTATKQTMVNLHVCCIMFSNQIILTKVIDIEVWLYILHYFISYVSKVNNDPIWNISYLFDWKCCKSFQVPLLKDIINFGWD